MKLNFFLSTCIVCSGSLAAQWTPAGPLAPGQGAEFDVVPFYVSQTQTLLALWLDDFSNFVPVTSISTNDGSSWQPTIQISSVSSAGADLFPAYDTNHNTLVVGWANGSFPFGGLIAASTDGGNTWGSPQQIPGSTVFNDIALVYDSHRTSLLAAWANLNTEFPQVASSTNGGATWNSPVTITTSSMANFDVFSSFDSSSNNITATWLDKSTSIPMSSTSMDGGATWTAATQISTEMGSMAYYGPYVLTLYNPVFKTTVATWVNSSTNLPMASISTNDGITWDSPITIGSTTSFSNIATAVDPVTGIIMATWAGFVDSAPYYSISEDGGMTWTPAAAISTTDLSNEMVFVTFDSTSRAFVATWPDFTLAPNYAIFALPPLPPPVPPPVPPAPPTILTNQGGNLKRLAVYLNKLAIASPQIIDPLIALTPNELKKALTAILPKPSIRLSAANTVLLMCDIFPQRCEERTILRHMEKPTSQTLSLFLEKGNLLAYNGNMLFGTSQQQETSSLPYGSAQTSMHKKEKYAFWVEGLGEFAKQAGQDQLPSFRTKTGGAFAGFDYYCTNGQVSTAFAYANSSVKSSLEHNTIDFYALSIYGIGFIGDGFIEAGVWGVYNQYDQDRHISFSGFNEHAKADYHGWQCAPHLRVGYDFTCASHWILEPFASGDCAIVFQEGFSEHGAAPYNIRQKHTTSEFLQATGGLNAYTWGDQSWGAWIIRGTLAYRYKKGFHLKLHEALVGQPPSFSVIAYKTGQNLFFPGIEFFIRGNNGLFAAVNYDGQFGAKYKSNSVFGKIGIFF